MHIDLKLFQIYVYAHMIKSYKHFRLKHKITKAHIKHYESESVNKIVNKMKYTLSANIICFLKLIYLTNYNILFHSKRNCLGNSN